MGSSKGRSRPHNTAQVKHKSIESLCCVLVFKMLTLGSSSVRGRCPFAPTAADHVLNVHLQLLQLCKRRSVHCYVSFRVDETLDWFPEVSLHG